VREKRSCPFCLWKYVIFHGQKAFFWVFYGFWGVLGVLGEDFGDI